MKMRKRKHEPVLQLHDMPSAKKRSQAIVLQIQTDNVFDIFMIEINKNANHSSMNTERKITSKCHDNDNDHYKHHCLSCLSY